MELEKKKKNTNDVTAKIYHRIPFYFEVYVQV